jgi:ParB/RepB/Spo0J family partition protein
MSGEEVKPIQIARGVVEVKLSSVTPNPWNPNKQTDFMYEKEKTSIKEFGFVDPILCRSKDGKSFEIIDGEHRYRAMAELGAPTILVMNLGDIPDDRAKALTVLMNETRGKADHDLLSKLMHELNESVGQEYLTHIMPYSDREIANLVAHTEVDWDGLGANEPVGDTSTPAPSPIPAAPPSGGGEAVSGPRDPHAPLTKTISFSVPEEVHQDFMAQVERINRILFPDHDPADCAPTMALQAMVEALRQADLESTIGAAAKVE